MAPLKHKRIVIVEDEQALCTILQDHFGTAYHLTIFNDAESCLESVSTLNNVDLIIIDYHLVEMNGVELFKALKPQLPQAKFLFTTGYLPKDAAEMEMKAGFDALLMKPFQISELEKTIHNLLNE